MIFDKFMEFDPAGTAITVTAVSTNVFDAHGSGILPLASTSVKPGRDLGGGGNFPPKITVLVTTTFTAGGAATLNVQFQGAPDDGTNTNTPGTYATYAESGVIALASLVAGNRIFDIDWPRILPTPNTPALLPRFYRLNYVVATGPMTAGKLQAEITGSRDDQVYYIPGIVVAN